MKKIYTLVLAVFAGVAAMAADTHPRTGIDSRSVKENPAARVTVDGRKNGYPKQREQDKHFSSRYENDSWRNRNDHNAGWAYANDHRGYNYNYSHPAYGPKDHNDRAHERNDRYADHSDHGYGNSKSIQRRY